MKLVYPAIFTPCLDSPGFTVIVSDLPGCITEGKTLLEAIEMGQDAASGWILDELEDGHSFPPASDVHTLECPKDSFVSLLVLDMESYTAKYGSKAIRKNITIPAWLNTYGEKMGLNFSKILQDALMEAAQSKSTL